MSQRVRILVLVALLALALPAGATVVADRDVAELTRHAHLVVRARVSAQQVQWDERHASIVTRTFLEPTSALKGKAPQTVVVRQVGGELDGQRLAIAGMAEFRVGEEVVVFLERHPLATGEWVLESMAASKFTVVPTQRGPVLQRNVSGLTFVRPGGAAAGRPVDRAPAQAEGVAWPLFAAQVREGLVKPPQPGSPAPLR